MLVSGLCNLLGDDIIDSILDAAAQGSYTVRRGPVSATYRARFVLIGSMNPEEGRLRPQILDRFGLRLIVRGLDEGSDRLEAYRRVRSYQTNPRAFLAQYADELAVARDEIQSARQRLKSVTLPDTIARPAISLIKKMGIASLRAEIAWFEAARAYAAAEFDGSSDALTVGNQARVVAERFYNFDQYSVHDEWWLQWDNDTTSTTPAGASATSRR